MLTASVTLAQDSKWVTIYEGVLQSNSEREKTVDVETGDIYVYFYPMREIALWLYAYVSYEHDGKRTGNNVMSRIRFNCYTNEYKIMQSWVWDLSKKPIEMVEIPNAEYEQGWHELMKRPIGARIWQFAKSYYK